MRAILVSCSALALAACGGEVEPETVETVEEEPQVEEVVDEAPVPEIGSSYTALEDCAPTCEGPDGRVLEVTADPAGLTVTGPGEEAEAQAVDLSPVAEGHDYALGRTVEWRGATPEEPRVLIARVNVQGGEDPMAADESVLAVIRLAAPTCVIARVPPGPGQLVAARRFADRETLPDCLVSETEDEGETDA